MPETNAEKPIEAVFICGMPMIRVKDQIVSPRKIVKVSPHDHYKDEFTICLEGGYTVAAPGVINDLLNLTCWQAPGRKAWDPFDFQA